MNGGLIPNRYAKALYKFALEHNATRDIYEEMLRLAGSFESNPDLHKALCNPHVSTESKQNLLVAASGNSDNEVFKGFVRLIIDNRREPYTYEMALAYVKIFRDANNISSVKITTAIELPAEEIEKLKKLVKESFSGRNFEFSQAINPNLIGGFVMDVDQVRMDASISSEIENLRQKLLSTK